jgi:hypothetical protein
LSPASAFGVMQPVCTGGGSSTGRTADSDSVNLGSNPSLPAFSESQARDSSAAQIVEYHSGDTSGGASLPP